MTIETNQFCTPNTNRWRAFALLAVSYFMTVIDLTIVNMSLPTIGRDLHFSETSLQWVVTAYSLTFGGFLLLGGRAADLLGRRRVLMLGLAVFTAASLACALATGDGVPDREPGGAGTGRGGHAARRPVDRDEHVPGGRRAQQGARDLGRRWAPRGATVGLIAGGILTRYAGWQYIFYLNVPIGASALALAPRIVPDSRLATRRRRFDGSARSPAPAHWCCWWTRSRRRRSTAGAPRERSWCWRRRSACSSPSW